jgi:hypothetical protein
MAGSLSVSSSASAAEACPNEAAREAQHASFLPDCRAYELVSPPNKNGGDVMADSSRIRAAADGDAAEFPSLAGFGDVQGTSIASDYMSERSTSSTPGSNGWATHAITPRQDPLTLLGAFQALDPLYEGDFSADLSRGVYRAFSPLTESPDVANVENLYVRNDLRTPGAGSYQLLSECPACGSTPLEPRGILSPPRLDGASADFTHVIFDSRSALTAQATSGNVNLYEWANGTLRLAGVLPDGTGAAASIAGQNSFGLAYARHTISSDGSRIVFTDNSATGSSEGQLYERIDGTSTLQLNAPEDGSGSGPATAEYWDASADGKRVFFTTTQQLTASDTNAAVDLYMWNAVGPAGHRLILLSVDSNAADAPNDVQGVVGASDDGHFVYFAAAGQLVANTPRLGTGVGIYVWHDGVVSYIGQMATPGVDTSLDFPGTWGLNQLRSRVTPDGRHVLFMSHSGAGLLGYDQSACGSGGNGCAELYVYGVDAAPDGRHLHCASCNPSAAPATASAEDTVRGSTGTSDNSSHISDPISADGHWVFFSTAEALVPQDTNGKSDVYEYDTQTDAVHLISQGNDQTDSFFADASVDGHDVFFLTQQQLDGWDADGSLDLYDARIDGGFPEPPATPAPCGGEACHAALTSPPSLAAPASTATNGAGNLPGESLPVGKPGVKPLTRAQKLARALKSCRKKRGSPRRECETQARRRFGKKASNGRSSK